MVSKSGNSYSKKETRSATPPIDPMADESFKDDVDASAETTAKHTARAPLYRESTALSEPSKNSSTAPDIETLYEKIGVLADEYYPLIQESLVLKAHIAEYIEWQNFNHGIEEVEYKSALSRLYEQSRALEEKIAYSAVSTSIHNLENTIFAIEEKSGDEKLIHMKSIAILTIERDVLLAKYDKLVSLIAKDQEKLAICEQWKEEYGPETGYAKAVREVTEEMENAKKKLTDPKFCTAIYNKEEQIMQHEIKLFGKPKTEHTPGITPSPLYNSRPG